MHKLCKSTGIIINQGAFKLKDNVLVPNNPVSSATIRLEYADPVPSVVVSTVEFDKTAFEADNGFVPLATKCPIALSPTASELDFMLHVLALHNSSKDIQTQMELRNKLHRLRRNHGLLRWLSIDADSIIENGAILNSEAIDGFTVLIDEIIQEKKRRK